MEQIDLLEKYYKTYVSYLKRTQELADLLSSVRMMDEVSVDLLASFYEAVEMKNKYYNLLINQIEIVDELVELGVTSE